MRWCSTQLGRPWQRDPGPAWSGIPETSHMDVASALYLPALGCCRGFKIHGLGQASFQVSSPDPTSLDGGEPMDYPGVPARVVRGSLSIRKGCSCPASPTASSQLTQQPMTIPKPRHEMIELFILK